MTSTGTSRSEHRAARRMRSRADARPGRSGAPLAALALVVLAACSGDAFAPTATTGEIARADEAPKIDFAFALRWDDLADRLRVEVEVANRDTLGRDVISPTCNPTVDVFDLEDGRLVWSERRWQAETMSCQPFGPTVTVTPGVRGGVHREIRDEDVLGDSLPAGTYRAVFRFEIEQPDDGVIVSVEGIRLGLP